MESKQKLNNLRDTFQKYSIDAYIVPQTDVHQNEFLPAFSRRISWLTNFTGSAGLSIVATKKAAVFVDGRYTLQVRHEVDMNEYEPRQLTFQDIGQWLQETLKAGDVLGFDPWLLTSREFKQYEEICMRLNVVLKPIETNLIDYIWHDQPGAPEGKIEVYPEHYAGASIQDKLAIVCATIKEKKADAAFLSQLDSIAWLLNIRGKDVPYVPVPLAFAIIHQDKKVDLFIDLKKITPEIQSHLDPVASIYAYEDLAMHLRDFGKSKKSMIVDPLRGPWFVANQVEQNGGKIIGVEDVCLLPKSCKNAVEIEGMRQAHIKDGVAMVHILAWLQEAVKTTKVTEMDVVAKLREYRDQQGVTDDSFSTITGSGPNGAIVHYRVTPETNRALSTQDIFLLDSGGQYVEGTTDITRTMTFGVPTAEQKDRFTRVLKGHIQLATAKFPRGVSGHQLDSLARYALWQAGLDYAHGTGHGVGCYLSVHEGPQRISNAPNTVALQPGMVISNEPGYYKTDEYGIRIENLIVVTPCSKKDNYENQMLCFETITLAPIDRHLIEVSLLIPQERQWVNAYHERVRTTLLPLVQPFAKEWLEAATAAI